MRPAQTFVKLAQAYVADIKVITESHCVDGKSMMEMMTLAAAKGTELTIRATGREAREALKALAELVEGGFDEGTNNGQLAGDH